MNDLPWFVASYTMLDPNSSAVEQRELLEMMASHRHFQGWEVPFTDAARFVTDWHGGSLEPTHKLVVTLLPGTMSAMGMDPRAGLASNNEEARRMALGSVARCYEAIRRTNDTYGRNVVHAIELHSAPRVRGSVANFKSSLEEITSWDWGATEILVEHCDSVKRNQTPSKGFLTIEDEVEAVRATQVHGGTQIGLLINWGRSVIEGRRRYTAVEHIAFARDMEVLRGIIFSGCSDREPSRGGAWADMHLAPHLNDVDSEYSMLDEASIRDALRACGSLSNLSVLGMKITADPTSSLDRQRDQFVQSAALIVNSAEAFL